MNFAVDIDGVVANIEPEMARRIGKEFGVDPENVKRDSFYMHERYGIDPETMSKFIESEKMFGDNDFWYGAMPIEHNVQALHLVDVDHRVIFITGRHSPTREVTESWLVNKANINYHTVLMHALSAKHKAMKYCGAEFMIEDRYSEARTIAEQGYKSYLLRTPYTIDHVTREDNPEGLVFVNDIREVLQIEGLI